MKKMLMTATVPSMIGQFNMNNIDILLTMGYEVHVACNFRDRSIWPKERIKEFVEILKDRGIKYHQIEFSRSPKKIKCIRKSLYQMDLLMKRFQFEFVHCHTPMAGVISRISCHKNKIKVIYTAHGFHFYQGAPLINWIIFFPIEKFLSKWTDVIIAINKEDYKCAEKYFSAKRTFYIPGVGVDTEKFQNMDINRERKRKEIGILSDDIMIFSVGELNTNKNHKKVIEALSMIKDSKYHYFIAGEGELGEKLKEEGRRYGINLHLLGYRNDIPELLKCADLFVLPSIREGLNVSLMEAVSSGLPSIASNIRGNRELIDHQYLFDPNNSKDICDHIIKVISMDTRTREEFINSLLKSSARLDVDIISKKIKEVYV